MATLTPTLSLVSTDVTSDSLSLSSTDTLTVTGAVLNATVETSTTAAVFLAAADYTKSYVYLKNLSSTASEKIYIRSGATGSANVLELGAGEFAFYPWASDEDLVYDADAGTPAMEVFVFEA
jgi:hypothetical protein|tara:strand:- start:540 stop:905 length:366 start_codon:yes stop_codon:yes gene_type:complete